MALGDDAVDWLLASDPSIRWQALRDLTDSPADVVAAERARVATEGWGGFLLDRLQPGADSRQVFRDQPDWVVLESLLLLRAMGIDRAAPVVRDTVARLAAEITWHGDPVNDSEWHGKPFFSGEVEPCINGRVVAVGAYFGQDVTGIVDRLLTEQMADGGWNCEDDNGAVVGSFHTTINVLEGLLEVEKAEGGGSSVRDARLRGEEYLLQRRMYRRRSTGEVASETFTRFAFPPGYRYDALRGLDHLRAAGGAPDERTEEAIDLVLDKEDDHGRWPLDIRFENHLDFEMDPGVGQPSAWNTLRALRVLRWAEEAN